MGTQSARGEVASGLRLNAAGRKLIAAFALGALVLTLLGIAAAGQARAADPLPSFTPGRHVYDYGDLLTPQAQARAEAFAMSIEEAGGGRVVIYTDDLLKLPSGDTIAESWQVDGILLIGWESSGSTVMGTTLEGRLSPEAGRFIRDSSSGFESFESFALSTLARVDGFLHGTHVFDGAGALDSASHQKAEAAATSLGEKLKAPVYIDLAASKDSPESTAFFSNMSSSFAGSLVIAFGVHDTQIGGYIDADSALWDAYETRSPWTLDTLSDETAPGGDVQAAVLAAIDAVGTPLSPTEVGATSVQWVRDRLTSFFSVETNLQASVFGLLASIAIVLLFLLDRLRRRREGGYADDDSVLLPAPPPDMTPALASLVASPLDSTRAITVALLDLAAHGRIAFYDGSSPFGPAGAIRVVGGPGSDLAAGDPHGTAASAGLAGSRPLGPAEESLLAGLRSRSETLTGSMAFGELRPLFEQTAEQLEQIARVRGWLNLGSRSTSAVWTAIGGALYVAAGLSVYFIQPVAAVCLGMAGLVILPGSRRMPLPLRTADGAMTTAMVGAYRRTLRRALSGAPGTMPPWLANSEEAALWGYAWGLEGDVQAFVGRNVDASMLGATGQEAGGLASISMLLQGAMYGRSARPVGLDTDAIAEALGRRPAP
jgi:hypothetical protein